MLVACYGSKLFASKLSVIQQPACHESFRTTKMQGRLNDVYLSDVILGPFLGLLIERS